MITRIGVIVVFAGMLCAGCASSGVSPASSPSETSLATAAPLGGHHAGVRVYKDPQTGEFAQPSSTDISTAASVARSFSRSHVGLVEVLNTEVQGGGVKMDLQGRFRSHFVATKDTDGKLSVRCVPGNELPKL